MNRYIALVGLLVLIIGYNFFQISIPYIKQVDINGEKIKSKFKITHISDYHDNRLVNWGKLVLEVEEFSPDIIILTGDMVDRNTQDFSNVYRFIEALQVIAEVYYVNGNHEIGNPLYQEYIDGLKSRNINMLNNTSKAIGKNDGKIGLFGIEFYSDRENYLEVVKDMDEDYYNILLSHSPDKAVAYTQGKEDLILSGHTHGGQIRIPFLGALLAPQQGFMPKYSKGLYDLGKTKLYIDSGLGNSLLAVRLFNRVQISNISIN